MRWVNDKHSIAEQSFQDQVRDINKVLSSFVQTLTVSEEIFRSVKQSSEHESSHSDSSIQSRAVPTHPECHCCTCCNHWCSLQADTICHPSSFEQLPTGRELLFSIISSSTSHCDRHIASQSQKVALDLKES